MRSRCARPESASHFVKALMSAPAQNSARVGGGEDHRSRALKRLPGGGERLDDVRRERVGRRVVEPDHRDLAAALELDRPVAAGERVRVEALASLDADPALREQPAQDQRLGVELDRVQPRRVGAREHPARRGVDVLQRGDALLEHEAGLEERVVGGGDPRGHEAVGVGAADRRAADLLGEVGRGLRGLGRRLVALDDLDDARAGGVEADDLLRAQRDLGDLRHRELGSARGQDRQAGRDGVELGEDRVLERQVVLDGLDHEVDVAEALVGVGRRDQAEDPLDLSRGALRREPTLLDELRRRLLGERAGALEPFALEQDRDPGGRDRLGQLGARADDRRFEHEHGATR